ncbi:Deoxyhypusine hydroxylase [Zea mays]|uniref:Deoxyhypusine hydroxylase n=1 Tax=Zea mays TaxID=4577 RepID=A0A1D6QAQ1_MAIZE|nr:Deoxyhypusine hydroxylase [Zea mays]
MRRTPSRSASGRSSPSVPPQPPRGCAAPSSKLQRILPTCLLMGLHLHLDKCRMLRLFLIWWQFSKIFLYIHVFHEVAYVLGQLQNKTASDAHSTVVKNVCEHPMARHEAAEALGSMRTKRALCFWRSLQRILSP